MKPDDEVFPCKSFDLFLLNAQFFKTKTLFNLVK